MLFSGASLAVSGVFYVLFGFWWHLQTTKKFWSAQRHGTPFNSTVTFPCCTSLKKWPVEGIFKLLSSIAVCSVCITWLLQEPSSHNTDDRNEALGQLTVFLVFVIAGICDIFAQCCQKYFFPNLDFLAMLFSFNLQSIVLAYHTESQFSWASVADAYAMIAATGTALAFLLEFRFPASEWCALMRGYCATVLGTWLLHMVLCTTCADNAILGAGADPIHNLNLTNQVINDTQITAMKTQVMLGEFKGLSSVDDNPLNSPNIHTVMFTEYEELSDPYYVWVPILFASHCGAVLVIFAALWLLTYCCASRGHCVCVPGEEDGVSHFENRVHFDYHVINRMTDSDLDD